MIRREPERVREALLKKMDSVDLESILRADDEYRAANTELEEFRSERNKLSQSIGQARAKGLASDDLMRRSEEVNARIAVLEPAIRIKQESLDELLSALPNLPANDVVAGGKEANQVIRTYGAKPPLLDGALDHVALSELLGLVDYERGTKLGGAGFWIYTGRGAALEWALLNYFCKLHYSRGYRFILPPHILTTENGYAAGQFPKFYDDVFHVRTTEGERERFLIPTAETSLLNIYRDEILEASQLPMKLFAYTPCYRKEAGGARADERGTIRGHQFNKVEMFHFVEPEGAMASLDELLETAEFILRDLGLHFQTSKLAARDISASMAMTYDVEVWLPSLGVYKEVSSVSWAGDFQARRAKIRYREKAQGAPKLLHTLNASGLATSRLVPAILEQCQLPGGRVAIPEPLRDWLGTDVFEPL
ncbi:MAG: serine--tRNA ligase [Rhizobacter sp.]